MENEALALVEHSYQDAEEFIASIRDAHFVSRCGGPYPAHPLLVPTSREQALDLVAGSVWDATAHLPFDKRLVDAQRAVHRGPEGAGLLWRFASMLGFGQIGPARKRVEKEVYRIVRNAKLKRVDFLSKRGDAANVEDFLIQLFWTVGGLIVTSHAERFPMLRLACDVAIAGYIPAGLTEDEAPERLLVY